MSWGMVAGAAITAVGSYMSSRSSSKAAGKAAEQQMAGIEKGVKEVRKGFGTTEEEFAPFRLAGTAALGKEQTLLGLGGPEAQQQAFAQFQESPAQAFLRKRGEDVLLRKASAIGGLGGGNIKQALQEQGIGVASQQLGDYQNRLSRLSGSGLQATQTLGGLRSDVSTNVANLYKAQAEAQAGGTMGKGEAKSSGIGGIAGAVGGLFSDERVKTDIKDLNLEECFNTVIGMDLKAWRYIKEIGMGTAIHLGPIAQDAPECIKGKPINGIETLDLHDELMLIAGALQYAHKNGLLSGGAKCH